MQIIRSSLLLFLLFAMKLLYAQENCTLQISGKITDLHDGQLLPFSTVYIIETGKGTVADSLGNYVLRGLCPGNYTLHCSHLGSDEIVYYIELRDDLFMNLHPEIHAEELGISEIQGEMDQEFRNQNLSKIESQQLDELSGKSLAESLKTIIGVQSLNTGSSISKPVIRGLHSNRIIILNNGVRQEGQQWGNEHAPEIDPFIADEIELIKGASSVRFGPDALGGIVLLKPKALPDSVGIDAKLSLSAFSNGQQGVSSGLIQGKFKALMPLSWRLQGTLKRSGNVQAPGYYLKNTGMNERNFSWAMQWKKKNYGIEAFYSQFNSIIGIFSAAHIGNLSDLQLAFDADQPLESADFTYEIARPRQELNHELFKLNGYVKAGDKGKLLWTYARQYNLRMEYDKHLPLNDSLAALNLPALQFEITTHSAELVWEHYTYRSFKGSLGIAGLYQFNTYEGRFFIPFFEKNNMGIFWLERWNRPDSKLEVEAGLRYDLTNQQVFIWQDDVLTNPEYQYRNISANIGVLYNFKEASSLRLNFAKAWRPPHVSEMYSNGLHHGSATVEYGDVNLKEEEVLTGSLALIHSIKKAGINIEIYHNYFSNFIVLQPELPPTLTIRGAFPTYRFAQVQARMNGMDAELYYDLTDALKFRSKASFLAAWNKSDNEYLVLMPANRLSQSIEYKFQNKSAQRRFFRFTWDSVFKQNRVPEMSDFVDPPRGYHLLGLSFGADLKYGNQTMSIGLEISNLLNTSYRDYLNRFRYYSDEMGRNIMFRINIPIHVK